MKKLISFLFSMFFTGLLLIFFAIAIGYATFVENDYGTLTAKILIYNSWWFEVLLFVIIINLTGSIFVNKLITKKKWTIFLFHVAFIVILAGAALTRYFGFEGTMHIREGKSSNSIISTATFIKITATANGQSETIEKEVKFTGYTGNRFSEKLEVGGKSIHIKNIQFMPSA
ncbi:MAG: cytochrome c biogenesis protein ResB, partial [Prolixibacteraceae bacterium]|nr:cytochrome c biogenesis protein ResB [Prolixibacteraceae bacterium]